MKSVMHHRFSEVPSVSIPRSSFNRSHGVKTTFDGGYLVPIMVDEALPGDTFNVRLSGFARLATPVFPIMDNMVMETFFFAVPYRLVWSNWQKFCGERIDPGDSIDYTIPVIDDVNNVANESLADYMGLPTKIAAAYEVSALPFRAYNLIWNEWFRDQNLQDQVEVGSTARLDDGPDDIADYVLLRRGKRHDYFTSCLPWLQKGDAVTLALGTVAPVVSTGVVPTMSNASENRTLRSVAASGYISASSNWGATGGIKFGSTTDETLTGLETDLSAASASTVNEFRLRLD